MKIRLEKLKREHLEALGRGKAVAEDAVNQEFSYSLFSGDELLLCGGVFLYWKNRGEAWAILAPGAKRHAVGIRKAAKKFLSDCPITRIEAAASVESRRELKWIESLGFKFQCFANSYFPDGKDAAIYSRVRCA